MVKKYMDETKKGFMQNIGDLSFKKIDETNYEFSIKVEEKLAKAKTKDEENDSSKAESESNEAES